MVKSRKKIREMNSKKSTKSFFKKTKQLIIKMPYKALTHDEARLKCCCICYRKGDESITDTLLVFIRLFAVPNYVKGNPSTAQALCCTCRNVLRMCARPSIGKLRGKISTECIENL